MKRYHGPHLGLPDFLPFVSLERHNGIGCKKNSAIGGRSNFYASFRFASLKLDPPYLGGLTVSFGTNQRSLLPSPAAGWPSHVLVVGSVKGVLSCMEYAEVPHKSIVKLNARSCKALHNCAGRACSEGSVRPSGLTKPQSVWRRQSGAPFAPPPTRYPASVSRPLDPLRSSLLKLQGDPNVRYAKTCKICGEFYTSKCPDSRVCPKCRRGKRGASWSRNLVSRRLHPSSLCWSSASPSSG